MLFALKKGAYYPIILLTPALRFALSFLSPPNPDRLYQLQNSFKVVINH